MNLIAHRGNITGPNKSWENNPDYVLDAINQGFDVEVDVWLKDGGFFLGHDAPAFPVDWSFLTSPALWCHAKNIDALRSLVTMGAHCFFHDADDAVLTSRGFLWTFPGKQLTNLSICVMPERASYTTDELRQSSGICSDYIIDYKERLDENT